MRKLLIALALLAAAVPAIVFAQAPPAVPALPDTERRVSYTLSAQTGPFSVPFAIYGDGTDYGNWLEVWLNGVKLTPIGAWTLSLSSGASIATAARPLTNAQVTLNAAQTGTLQIIGARRPRRTSQFTENRGVAARDLNQVITDEVAQLREAWDFVKNRVIQAAPGDILPLLPPATQRKGLLLGFDGSTGQVPTMYQFPGPGSVAGPGGSVDGRQAIFDGDGNHLKAGHTQEPLDVIALGADPTGGGDSTTAFQAAIDQCRNVTQAKCAVRIPGGTYLISSLNCTNMQGLTFEGIGALTYSVLIKGNANGVAMWDCTGSQGLKVKNLMIGTQPGINPRFGFVVAPSTTVGGMDSIGFEDVAIQGNFNGAAIYLDRTGSSYMKKVQAINFLGCAGCYTVIVTGSNVGAYSSPFTTTATVTSVGTSDWNFYDIDFHAIHTSGGTQTIPIWLDGWSGVRFWGGNASCLTCTTIFKLTDAGAPFPPGFLTIDGFGVYVEGGGGGYVCVFDGTGSIKAIGLRQFGVQNTPTGGKVFCNTGSVTAQSGADQVYLAGSVTAGTTNYFGPTLTSTSENNVAWYRFDRALAGRMKFIATPAPGGAETFTIKLRYAGADVPSFACTITGAATTCSYSATYFEPSSITSGYAVQIVASGGAASATISGTVEFVPVSLN